MADKMRLWISEMNRTLFNGSLERLNANCLAPYSNLDQGDGEFLLELLLFTQGGAINLSLKLDSNTLGFGQAQSRDSYLSLGLVDLKLQPPVGSHVRCPICLIFSSSFLLGKFFRKYASWTNCRSPNILQ